MASGHIEALLDSVDVSVNNYVFSVYAGVADEMSTTLRLVFILFFIIYGISMAQGWIQTSIQDFVRNFVRMTIIFVFATNWTLFNQIVYTTFTASPNHLGGVMLASAPTALFSNVTSVNGVLGDIYDQSLYAASIMMFESDTWDIAIKSTGLGVGAITLLMVCYAAFLIAMAKIATAILLGFSPVFIAFMVFPASRGMFEGWLRQLLNFALIPVITYGILIFVVTLSKPVVDALSTAASDGQASTTQVFPFLLAIGVSIILLKQVMGIAAGIAGGIQLSTLGTISAAVGSIWRNRHLGPIRINTKSSSKPTNDK